MDKKLNRQIGYKKPTTVKATSTKATNYSSVVAYTVVKKEKPAPSPEEAKAIKEKKIIAWINSHPMFKWGSMCLLLKINKGNFHGNLSSKKPFISLENIKKIEQVISDYGYEK